MHTLVRIFSHLSDKFQAELELFHHVFMQIDQVLKDTVWDILTSVNRSGSSKKKKASSDFLTVDYNSESPNCADIQEKKYFDYSPLHR
jgi:hypothetical protein